METLCEVVRNQDLLAAAWENSNEMCISKMLNTTHFAHIYIVPNTPLRDKINDFEYTSYQTLN